MDSQFHTVFTLIFHTLLPTLALLPQLSQLFSLVSMVCSPSLNPKSSMKLELSKKDQIVANLESLLEKVHSLQEALSLNPRTSNQLFNSLMMMLEKKMLKAMSYKSMLILMKRLVNLLPNHWLLPFQLMLSETECTWTGFSQTKTSNPQLSTTTTNLCTTPSSKSLNQESLKESIFSQ